MKKFIIFYISIFLFFISCKKDNNPEPSVGPGISTLNSYPLQLGNEWKYHTAISFTSDSINFSMNDYGTYRFDSVTSFGNYSSVYAMIAVDSTDDGSIYNYTKYYFQNSSGLYNAGYIFGSNPRVFLRNGNKIHFKLGNRIFHNPKEAFYFLLNLSSTDSLIIEDPPLLTLKYPAVQNVTWTYRDYNEPFYLGKKYEGYQTVTTNAGVFHCYKVRFLYDFDEDGIIDPEIKIYQYISPMKGLIKSTQEVQIFVTDNIGTVIDTGLYVQNSILTSVNF